jgi:hypothetical protein
VGVAMLVLHPGPQKAARTEERKEAGAA